MFRKLLLTQLVCLLTFAQAMSSPIEHHAIVDSFEKVFGVYEGKRRNHTKGFCFTAQLSPKKSPAQDLSHSFLFHEKTTVLGRFSHKGGNAHAADDKIGEYGMSLLIENNKGQRHIMAMNTLDFFPVATPQAFAQLMRAKASGKEAVKAFKAKNKDLQRFKANEALKAKTLSPYEDMVFNSVNSFYLVNEKGNEQAVRWSFVPTNELGIVTKVNNDFFFQNIQENLTKRTITWKMQIWLAREEDEVNNPAVPWSKDNVNFTAATLTLLSVEQEVAGNCDLINFDPLVLANGVKVSDDPILHARRPTYGVSFGRRMAEQSQ